VRVWNFPASIARIIARISARPRVSSPMPGAISRVPSRFTVTSVPSGNTVSRCATTATSGPPAGAGAAADAHDVAFGVHLDVVRPCCRSISRYAFARRSSLNGGAGISVSVISSLTKRS
jgi:hypothetical protein